MKKAKEHKLAETISVVSHQFKTPLSAIKGYLEVLIAEDLGKINKEQKEYLTDTLENTKRMISLVKDLLDVSRVEQGKLELKMTLCSLEKIVKKVITEIYPFARANNCNISLKVLNKIPKIKADSLKIEQVISNFISNAVSYTRSKKRGIINVFLEKKGRNIVFCCKDNGIGISKEDKKKVFNKFFRSEEAMVLDPGGSGFGLFISKAIIEKNKGKIWFKSEKGKGSSFCFSLPIKT